MGNASHKPAVPDTPTGLTPCQVKLVQSTWQTFCSGDREYGVLPFLFMFAQHPRFLALFPNFRYKAITTLMDDPVFRAHGCAIGYHLSSMVASLEDAAALEVLVRRNAAEHLKRDGVKPAHFEVMGSCIVEVMRAKDERHMTAEAIQAWWKFITYLVAVIRDVYDEAASGAAEAISMEWSRTAEDSGSTAAVSVTGCHVGTSEKQPHSTLEPVRDPAEEPAVLQAADQLTAVSPVQDAARAPACRASAEMSTNEEAGREACAHQKAAHRQGVDKGVGRKKMAPMSGHKQTFREIVERKEQATS